MLKEYKIGVIWQQHAYLTFNTETLEEAIKLAEEYPKLPSNGEYIDDSWEIDYEGIVIDYPEESKSENEIQYSYC